MTTHYLQSNKFYILSGIPASGKSTFTNQLVNQGLPQDSIVSSDSIRKSILGTTPFYDAFGEGSNLIGWEIQQPQIFKIIDDILTIRFNQKLTTIFDAKNIDDSVRKHYVDLAKKYGMETEIILFDIDKDIAKERLSNRKERFDINQIDLQHTTFQKDSVYKHIVFNQNDNVVLIPNLIKTSKVDIIGDVHGLYDELLDFLKSNDWNYNGSFFEHKDKERKLLFLGDIVDRGDKSIEVLKAVYNSVINSTAYFILGNHEAKLINNFEEYINNNIIRSKSLSSSETFLKFLNLPKNEQVKLYEFLKFSPIHYCMHIDKEKNNSLLSNEDIVKFAFVHANNSYFNPFKTPYSFALYGQKNKDKDTDKLYEDNFNNKLNEYIYIRGHIPNISNQNNIYSLEEHQAFKGNLVILPFDKYLSALEKNNWASTHSLFKENIMTYKTNFDYDIKIKSTVELLTELSKLQKDGLVSDGWKKDEHGNKEPHPDGFKIYKYSKKVHFKRLWKDNLILEKARGLVISSDGNIIVHPFDKIYNYGEYDVGNNIDLNKQYQVIEKLNGFLGCISKHPFKNELLFSTTGSLTSDFVNYIKFFIDNNEEQKNKLLNYFKSNKKTLMFEVLHPEDKHIIEYDPKDYGLWLIGARGLDINSKPENESYLDDIAKELNFRRPKWYSIEFKDLLEDLKTSKLEGVMVRDLDSNETLMKIKTNYYLVTKFIGRLGPKMTDLLFANPEKFKELHVDEEFYPIVDLIVKNKSKEEFNNMTTQESVEFVRNIVNTVRDKVNNNLKI